MSPQKGNGSRGDPWRGQGSSPPDILDLIRQAQDQLYQLMPGGGPRGLILIAAIVLVGVGAWTTYYTVPSDSVAVVPDAPDDDDGDGISRCRWALIRRQSSPSNGS